MKITTIKRYNKKIIKKNAEITSILPKLKSDSEKQTIPKKRKYLGKSE